MTKGEKDKIVMQSSNGSTVSIYYTTDGTSGGYHFDPDDFYWVGDLPIEWGKGGHDDIEDQEDKLKKWIKENTRIYPAPNTAPNTAPIIPAAPWGTKPWDPSQIDEDWAKGLGKKKEEGNIEIRPAPSIADILVEIAKLDILEVNQILDKYGVTVKDKDGNVIYDPEERENDIAEQDW